MTRTSRSALGVPLVGVTLAQTPGARLAHDATGLERALFGLLDLPRAPLALCAVVPAPPEEAALALRRLVAAGAVRVLPARSNPGVPFRTRCRLPDEPHINEPATRARTLRPGELEAALAGPANGKVA
jgi:hypothetical protein